MKRNKTLLLFPLLAAACGGSSINIGAFDGGGSAPDTGAPLSGPGYEVHLQAIQAPVPFTDGLSGETPTDQRAGIRKTDAAARRKRRVAARRFRQWSQRRSKPAGTTETTRVAGKRLRPRWRLAHSRLPV